MMTTSRSNRTAFAGSCLGPLDRRASKSGRCSGKGWNRYGRSRSLFSSIAVASVLILMVAASLSAAQATYPPPRKADDKNAPKRLTGQVVNTEKIGLSGAVVYLKDQRTSAVKTDISDERGGYVFSGLDLHTDYEVYAEFKGTSSVKRTVSEFDTRKDIYLVLEIGATP